jgi:hypothetical protein
LHAVKTNPARSESLSQSIGIRLNDEFIHPSLMLSFALGAAPNTMILVSSKSRENLAACVEGIDWAMARGERPEHIALLRRFIEDNGTDIETG